MFMINKSTNNQNSPKRKWTIYLGIICGSVCAHFLTHGKELESNPAFWAGGLTAGIFVSIIIFELLQKLRLGIWASLLIVSLFLMFGVRGSSYEYFREAGFMPTEASDQATLNAVLCVLLIFVVYGFMEFLVKLMLKKPGS